jgi:hypothetical protein
VTSEWTSQNERSYPEPNRKCQEIPMHLNTLPNAIDKIRDKFEVMKTSDRPTKGCKHM